MKNGDGRAPEWGLATSARAWCRCERSGCWQRGELRGSGCCSRWSTSFSSRSVSSPARGPLEQRGSCSAARVTASALDPVRASRACASAAGAAAQSIVAAPAPSRSPWPTNDCSRPRVTCRQSSDCPQPALHRPIAPTPASPHRPGRSRRRARVRARRRRPLSASACVRPPRHHDRSDTPPTVGGDRRADRPQSRHSLPAPDQVTLGGLGEGDGDTTLASRRNAETSRESS